jgi:ribosomal protein L22
MAKLKKDKNYEAVSEAKHRHARMPARKARLIADLIRGKRVAERMPGSVECSEERAAQRRAGRCRRRG